MSTSSEHLPKRAKTAALRQVQVCFHSAKANEDVYRYIKRGFAKICKKGGFKVLHILTAINCGKSRQTNVVILFVLQESLTPILQILRR